MKVMLNIASTIGDVTNLIFGKDFINPVTEVMNKYPNLLIS